MHKRTITVILRITACGALSFPAHADPWIPPNGAGVIKPVIRFYHGARLFPRTRFGATTTPSNSVENETQIRLTGDHGLGHDWALQYDLRAARETKSKTSRHNTTRYQASGLGDQEIGIVHGLHQGRGFADSIAINAVLATGSTTSNPRLGVGHDAVEPDYEFGFSHRLGSRFMYGSFAVGPRIFTNSGIVEWRMAGEVGTQVVPRFYAFATFFSSRTFGSDASNANAPNASEYYNIARVGLGIQYKLTQSFRPLFQYEKDVAGQNIHAGHRVVIGFSWKY